MATHADNDGHAHDHTAGANARQLTIALVLTGTFLVVEVAGGIIFNSLALLSDAAHMFTDAAALAIALAAIRIGAKPADDKRTFGYRRFEILAAAFNAVLLFLVAGYVLYEGVKRILEPQPVGSIGMLAVAAAGLVVNLIAMRLLASGKDRSLNVKGAYLEVWADMLGSVGVLIGAAAIWLTGWRWVDPVVAILIGLWVLPRTWILLRAATHVLLEGAPAGLRLAEVRGAIAAMPGVSDVHDLHAWTSGADVASASVHVVVTEAASTHEVRQAVSALLSQRFGVEHVTVQIEVAGEDPHAPLHE
ncbi:cation diffusion facilitator family transporter [Caulobacter mirabilis]|uniref:Cation transporter n=1 Tax=Caulobacter mirabilis TaxID=69666 RepID=A0A2D2AYA9_9CAUL|nr:cation diffusion facilitator family transporter [Caulobacter mirabilis]ATQ42917.1 cation transporter [Caulobacter mirabilis]